MLYNEAVKNENPNAILPYTEEDIQNYRNGTLPDTDWYDETFKKNALETYLTCLSMEVRKKPVTMPLSVIHARMV